MKNFEKLKNGYKKKHLHQKAIYHKMSVFGKRLKSIPSGYKKHRVESTLVTKIFGLTYSTVRKKDLILSRTKIPHPRHRVGQT